jgi:hypothetical protein
MSITATKPVETIALFDTARMKRVEGVGIIEFVPLEHVELADNPRKEMAPEGLERLAGMMMRSGQLVPCIGRRVADDRVVFYAGQRRFIAAKLSHGLAGTEGYEDLQPLAGLVVNLLDHEPTADEIRRIQAQENQREPLSRFDQQEQFRDCWEARAGMGEDDRMLAVCEDLGIDPKQGHNLRRELTLPEEIRSRVSDKPTGDQLAVKTGTKLAQMNKVSPALAQSVAAQIVDRNQHDQFSKDPAGFIHKTVRFDESVYARRIDMGAELRAADEIEQARGHLTSEQQTTIAAMLTAQARDKARAEGKDDTEIEKIEVKVEKLDEALDKLTNEAKRNGVTIRVDDVLRDRARNGGYAHVEQRSERFADGIWVTDPMFLLDEVISAVGSFEDDTPAQDESFFGGADVQDDDMENAAADAKAKAEEERKRQREAFQANMGLGLDIRTGLMDPKDRQLDALRTIVCHLLVSQHPDVIAYGAGWTDQERQQPVGDTSRFEPRQADAIVDAELKRALAEKDPLKGIAQLVARFGAAFMLDPDGVTKTKALGSERMSKKLREALPGGDSPLREAIWEFLRPMMSPHLIDLNKDAFVTDAVIESSVDLAQARGDVTVDALDLGEDEDELLAAAA